MRDIINGRKYDIETATLIKEHSRWSDSASYDQKEHFYKKKNGEFFRHDMKRTTWGSIHEYEKIIPLTDEQAKSALEKIMHADNYEKVFGKVEE